MFRCKVNSFRLRKDALTKEIDNRFGVNINHFLHYYYETVKVTLLSPF